jgi:hypothetical protein
MARNPYQIDIAQPNLKPVMQGIGSLVKESRDAANKERVKTEFGELLNSDDMDALYEFSVSNPEYTDIANSAIKFKNEGTRKNLVQTMMNLDRDPDNFAEYLNLRNDYLDSQGSDNIDTQELLAQFAENPEQALAEVRSAMPLLMNKQEWKNYRDFTGLSSDSDPATVKEWKFYNNLDKDKKTEFLNMKRQGFKVQDIGSVPHMVNTNQPDSAPIPLSSLSSEADAEKKLAEAKQLGASEVTSAFKEIDSLKSTEGGRASGMAKASKFYDLLDTGKMNSGGMRKFLSYIPFTFTEQGQMDEEFNAFAETAARQALKESGEIRPTDADVKGMKQAMFGVGRDENVNKSLLKEFMGSIKKNNHKAYLYSIGNKYRADNPTASDRGEFPQTNANGWQLMKDGNGNQAYVSPDGQQFESVE